jgi:O-antigen/teichoic acid export membrane protein
MIKKFLTKFPGYSLVGNIFATATFRQSGITFSGTFINGALGALFYILAARYLGPASFGILTVAITTLTLIGDIGDLGTDTGLVRFVGKYRKKNEKKADKFLKLGLEIKLVVSLVILVLGFLLSSFLANTVFSKPELTLPLKLASVGVLTYLLFSYITHVLQGFEKFWHWSGIQVLTNLTRLVLVCFVIYFAFLSVENTLIIYILMPLLGFIVGYLFLPEGFLRVKNEVSVAREFFHYNKWVAAFTLVAAVSSRLDTFISARLLSATQLGLYSAANQLVQIVPQLVGAIGTVIAPKVAGMDSLEKLVEYLKKAQLMVIGIMLLGIISIPVMLFLIPILFGKAYVSSGALFVILLFAMLVFLISVPVHMAVFYYFSYPKLFFWLSLLHLGIISGLGWNLISIYGAIGASVTVLVGQIANFVIPAIWVFRKVSND